MRGPNFKSITRSETQKSLIIDCVMSISTLLSLFLSVEKFYISVLKRFFI